jgi:hypothetical protein
MTSNDFAAYAARLHIAFPTPVPPERMLDMLESFMGGVALDCLEAGTTLIGHIKCLAEAGDDPVTCSITEHSAKVRSRGSFENPEDHLEVLINILQYGLVKEEMEHIVTERGERSFPGRDTVEIEDLEAECEEEHDHDHDHLDHEHIYEHLD